MNGSGWFESEDRILSDINITPLVDVALVLLIIFMITAPMMVQGADVRLPQTQQMDMLPESSLTVSVQSDREIRINNEPVTYAELEARLSPLITPGRSVQFRGDGAVDYQIVMQVMAVIRNLGGSVGLVIDPSLEQLRR